MKVDISRTSILNEGHYYRLSLTPENENDVTLLEFLTEESNSLFTSQEDGVVCVLRPKVKQKEATKKKRTLSQDARNRIAKAQKKRWAKYHKAQKVIEMKKRA